MALLLLISTTSPTFLRYNAREGQRTPSNLQRSTMKSSEPDCLKDRGGKSTEFSLHYFDMANEAKSFFRPIVNYSGSGRILRVAWKIHPGVIGMALKS